MSPCDTCLGSGYTRDIQSVARPVGDANQVNHLQGTAGDTVPLLSRLAPRLMGRMMNHRSQYVAKPAPARQSGAPRTPRIRDGRDKAAGWHRHRGGRGETPPNASTFRSRPGYAKSYATNKACGRRARVRVAGGRRGTREPRAAACRAISKPVRTLPAP